jgi:hypothetical protein
MPKDQWLRISSRTGKAVREGNYKAGRGAATVAYLPARRALYKHSPHQGQHQKRHHSPPT